MKDGMNKNAWVWVGIAVVILAALVAVFYKRTPATPPSTTNPPGEQVNPVYAAKGQVVSGFPQNLILDSGATVNSSYSINYSDTTNQYTAQWTSPKSVAAVYTEYQTYLPANGWTIANQASVKTAATIYAKDASLDVFNLSVTAVKNGSQVT